MFKPVLAAAFYLCATSLSAQDSSRTILVLDGSGSMWGQIDGKAKITIAQEVIGKLLNTLPMDQELGLTVYGHRRKGDCSDIETIIQPGGPRSAIADAVNSIQPKGKTPMTDAVIAAANALRFTEEKATVILVSDGIETCNPNVCEAARMLEETGVDFTAHVVGFNISDPEAIAQMQCLANETGGTFLSADNADELAMALETVAATPEPEPIPVEVSFRATLEVNGPAINDGLVWTFADGAAETSTESGDIKRQLLPGNYVVTVLRLKDETSVSTDFTVADLDSRVVLVLPKIAYQASISAVDQSNIGATIDVVWSARDVTENDYVSIAEPDDRTAGYAAFTYVKGSDALPLILPLVPGEYELRYIRSPKGTSPEILATQSIKLNDIVATLDAPEQIAAGSVVNVAWDGPNYRNDYISIAKPGDAYSKYSSYTYTEPGNPADITAPLEPGIYEIRYVANGNPDRILGVRSVQVVANNASLIAPEQAGAGEVLEIVWDGPNNKNDYVTVAEIDASPNKYINYTYTNKGSPLSVTMPLEPGSYELRYVANGNPDKILATRPIDIVAADVSLNAPDQAVAGSIIKVNWQGPDNKNDYISVAARDEKPQKYLNYKYTNKGTPALVKMPLEAGIYELRYIANGSPDKILASRSIKIVAAVVSLEAPSEAVAGSNVAVTWDGPNNSNDYISVANIDDAAQKYVNYRYTSRSNPVDVKMPLEPGEYQIRYVANGNPDKILATKMINVVAANVALDAPDQGVIGASIEVSYIGPNNQNDYISVAEIGSAANKYVDFKYTARGNPVTLDLPEVPGTYLIRYVANGSPVKVLARRSIKVAEPGTEPPLTAILEASESAGTGGQLEVFWVGPNAEGDTIVITKVGSSDAVAEIETSQGNPAILMLPEQIGQYMLHYKSGNTSAFIGSRPIILN